MKAAQVSPEAAVGLVHHSFALVDLVGADGEDDVLEAVRAVDHLEVLLDLGEPVVERVEGVLFGDVEDEHGALRVLVELVAHLVEDRMAGHVEYVDLDLALLHVHLGHAVVDADRLQVLGHEALLAVALDDAALAHLVVADADDLDLERLLRLGHGLMPFASFR